MPKIPANIKFILLLLLLGFVFLMAGNGLLSLTNPDEVFYSQTAREMQQQHSWMTPYLFGAPQFEKPIMTFWLLRLSFDVAGAAPFAARFFPAFFGIVGVIALYYLGWLGFRDGRKAFVSAVILMSCGLYVGLSRTVFTDLIFTVFILLSFLAFWWGYAIEQKRQAGWVLFFVCSALAVLTKGPLGLIIPLSVVLLFLVLRREARLIAGGGFPLGLALFCLVALPWYIFMFKTYGNAFVHEFFYNDHWRRLVEAEHPAADTWYYYPLSTVGSMFPWSLFFIAAFGGFVKTLRRQAPPFFWFLSSWVVVVFVVFQVAHSKLTSYVFPYFPALALMTGYFLEAAGAACFLKEMRPGARGPRALYLLTGVFCLAFPIGLIVALSRFPQYVADRTPVIVFAGILVVYLAVYMVASARRRFLWSFWMTAAFLPLLLVFALSMSPHFESYVSSRDAGRYLAEKADPDAPVLCSKFFARGIRFYTDRQIAVIDINGDGYFSPHPVEYLNTIEKLRDYLKRRLETYAVLRKDYVKGLGRLIGDDYRYDVLYVAGDEHIVRIYPKGQGSGKT
jgi:4-amino-4-deoxy-L-arabinose transferase-like glycosyltransferase